jgi:hypothetical protein
MKKFILGVLIAILLFPVMGLAAPFLVCDPQTGITYYKLTGPAWVPATSPAQADGSIKMDVAAALVGSNALTVAACVTNTIWGEVCSTTVPFSFSRPAAPATTSNIRLTP